jgi:hypothetical protein
MRQAICHLLYNTEKNYHFFSFVTHLCGEKRVFMLIDKPQTFIADLMKKKSKTITKLIEEYPELESKLAPQKII